MIKFCWHSKKKSWHSASVQWPRTRARTHRRPDPPTDAPADQMSATRHANKRTRTLIAGKYLLKSLNSHLKHPCFHFDLICICFPGRAFFSQHYLSTIERWSMSQECCYRIQPTSRFCPILLKHKFRRGYCDIAIFP